ncbi:hypothetical protein [Roseateles sp. L2-2]|uniref:hypothetical protein n=1 Tax=Roseateles sp. L2-2 TaxID=3422597 RepID=UPI003D36F963
MSYEIFPSAFDAVPSKEKTDCNVSLGGFFYDYLRAEDGRFVGVRYWLMETVAVDSHPVYSLFLADKRFIFARHEGFIDIVFDEDDSGPLQRGELSVDTVQDFGGECIIQRGGVLGIGFSFPE